MRASVAGEGPTPCERMVVGEAPGKTEIKEGRPFVGPAGTWLENLLATFGIARDEVYITNVVKHLPLDENGKIRRPTPEECEEWKPILDLELASVRPEKILVLGDTARLALLGREVSWGTSTDRYTIAWHPAYVLRNQRLFPEWRQQASAWGE